MAFSVVLEMGENVALIEAGVNISHQLNSVSAAGVQPDLEQLLHRECGSLPNLELICMFITCLNKNVSKASFLR